MQINVSQLLQEPVGATRDYQINEAAGVTVNGNCYQVQGKVRLLRTERSILAKAALKTEAELTCSRCLGPFLYPLTTTFEDEYLPTVDVVSGVPLPQADEPGAFTIDAHHILDLSEAIRQYTVLAIPMKPLCRQDCAGLCQVCGQNLNQKPCDCPAQEIDPRWSELTKLL